MARLRDGGYSLVVVTNQSAVARGLITEADLGEIHRELQRQLRDAGAEVDGVYYCPHHPEYGSPPYRQVCVCRKPNPGLLERAALELGLDLEGSYMVGDSLTDLQAGWNAGCGVVLVLTGCGTEAHREADAETLDRIDYIAGDLSEAQIGLWGSRCDMFGEKIGPGRGWLKRIGTGFAGSDAYGLIEGRDEDFAVSDIAGFGGPFDGVNGALYQVVAQGDFKFGFGKKIDHVFRAPVDLPVSLLSSEPPGFDDGHALDADFG
jgi:D,D-heptose 1,7-bisphosphate phosphatase